MTTETDVRYEVECDRKIAAAWGAFYKAREPGESLLQQAKSKRMYAKMYGPEQGAKYLTEAESLTERAHAIFKDAEPLRTAAIVLNASVYTGWTRFFLVSDGHIHSSTVCHTLRITTHVGWLPDLSGLTEADAVSAHGPLLCTVCFPSAPIEWTRGKDDPNRCSGSGSSLDLSLPHRTGYYSGNWGTCPTCGAKPAVTSTGRLRAHKPL